MELQRESATPYGRANVARPRLLILIMAEGLTCLQIRSVADCSDSFSAFGTSVSKRVDRWRCARVMPDGSVRGGRLIGSPCVGVDDAAQTRRWFNALLLVQAGCRSARASVAHGRRSDLGPHGLEPHRLLGNVASNAPGLETNASGGIDLYPEPTEAHSGVSREQEYGGPIRRSQAPGAPVVAGPRRTALFEILLTWNRGALRGFQYPGRRSVERDRRPRHPGQTRGVSNRSRGPVANGQNHPIRADYLPANEAKQVDAFLIEYASTHMRTDLCFG